MKKLILLFVFTSVFSSLATATESANFTIKNVGISAFSKSIWLQVNEPITNTTCEKKTQFRLEIEGNEEVYREILSMALTAKMANATVTVGYYEDRCFADASVIGWLTIR